MESKITNPLIKSRINKIDYELKLFFENVFIQDKFYKTGYFQISANKVSFLRESKEFKRLELLAIINQPDLLKDDVKWSYSTNPLNENAMWIDRVSKLDKVSEDMKNVLEELRFDESYIMDLECIVDTINESIVSDYIETEEDAYAINTFKKILEKYGISTSDFLESVYTVNENFINQASDRIVKLFHNSDIKISDMFKIEQEFQSMENVGWCVFKEGYIEINYTPNF